MRLFLIALSFFTRIPIDIKNVSNKDFYKSMLFLPVVGLVIGAILTLIYYLLFKISAISIRAFLFVFFYFYLTGGLHMDGVADTVDAIFSARTRERMLEIMVDSRLGAFGAISLILAFLGYFACFEFLFIKPYYYFILFYPIFGRYSAILLGSLAKSALPKGMGFDFIEVDNVYYSLLYGIILLIVCSYLNPILLIGFLSVCLFVLCEVFYFNKKLGGITGDQFGFSIELSQILFLIIAIILTDFI